MSQDIEDPASPRGWPVVERRASTRMPARFGCAVIDSYGTSEGGMYIMRVPGTPPGSLGVADEGAIVVSADTLQEWPPADFDEAGRLLNGGAATTDPVFVRPGRELRYGPLAPAG